MGTKKEEEGQFLGPVGYVQGEDFNGNTTESLAKFTTDAVNGLASLKMQIGLSGHRTPASVIEGGRADDIAAALDAGDTVRAGQIAGVRTTQTTAVGDVYARGDRVKYSGSRGNKTVTILKTNVGEVGKFEVADSKGNKWVTRKKNLSR
jgi:hypothetical protein